MREKRERATADIAEEREREIRGGREAAEK